MEGIRYGSIKIAGEDPFENSDIMQNISFHYEKNYQEEYEKVKNLLAIVSEYRPHYDAEYATFLQYLYGKEHGTDAFKNCPGTYRYSIFPSA